jgi:hypothetical protein
MSFQNLSKRIVITFLVHKINYVEFLDYIYIYKICSLIFMCYHYHMCTHATKSGSGQLVSYKG